MVNVSGSKRPGLDEIAASVLIAAAVRAGPKRFPSASGRKTPAKVLTTMKSFGNLW
ncbi:hypothetical protein Ari01nite_66920 [Paractinoplanes rishiriensis]|uniref:Uncharacterized protein n=1 Tax=Paractinoplanes rishiriensis TaxID=1050105 RepID=A0A919K4M7_9ACTN|nr:hypothetical protein Ari01nite_66920 [Actinoplanes rishiriensis]